uniref:SH3 domain-containing protein n=1 Tax=Amphimedon queenslandica TaxID=400682 RepID=A0A1X7SJN8_AMPQE
LKMAAVSPPHTQWGPGTTCIAKYNFPGSASHDLPLRRGDKIIIVKKSKASFK